MANVRETVLDVKIDSSGARQGSKEVVAATDSIGASLMAVTRKLGGYYAAWRAVKFIATESMQEEASIRRLEAATRLAGSAAQANLKSYKAYADKMADMTLYTDDQIRAEMVMALNMGVLANRIEDVTTAAIGLSERLGMDLGGAMHLIIRAGNGYDAMLARIGIRLDDTMSTQEKVNYLLNEGNKFLPLAKDNVNDASGAWRQFTKELSNAAEALGEPLLGPLTDIANVTAAGVKGLRTGGFTEFLNNIGAPTEWLGKNQWRPEAAAQGKLIWEEVLRRRARGGNGPVVAPVDHVTPWLKQFGSEQEALLGSPRERKRAQAANTFQSAMTQAGYGIPKQEDLDRLTEIMDQYENRRPIEEYTADIRFEYEALLATDRARAVSLASRQAERTILESGIQRRQEDIDKIEQEAGALYDLSERMELAKGISMDVNAGIRGMIRGLAEGRDAWDMMGDMALNVLDRILEKQLSVVLDSAMTKLWGGIAGAAGSANGNVFQGGSLVPFAAGGVLRGPMAFPLFGGRMGLAGEAGPEAIMPLRRGSSGRLGVEVASESKKAQAIIVPPTQVKVVNVFDTSIVSDYMNGPSGERVVMNIMRRNRNVLNG